MLKIQASWHMVIKRLRSLTVTQTAIALRPFILRVHPDLFSKYGKEKAKKNEDSLKKLNEYMHRLHNLEKVKPLSLLFYLRKLTTDANQNETQLQPVDIQLHSSSITQTIRTILHSCSLPLDYLTSLGVQLSSSSPSSSSSSSSSSPSDTIFYASGDYYWADDKWWEKSRHRSEERRKRRNEEESYKNYHQSIHAWLEKNSKRARLKVESIRNKKEEVDRLKSELKDKTGLVDVKWRDGWTMATHGTAMRTLMEIHKGLQDKDTLRGHTIIFSNVLGVSVQGEIILRQDTVATSWKKVISNISETNVTLKAIPLFEKHLSEIMGGMKIQPPRNSTCIAENYMEHILILIKSVKAHIEKTGSSLRAYNDLCISIECTTGPLIVTEDGDIMIPTSCPIFLIFDFISENAIKARSLKMAFKETQVSDQALMSLCQSMLNLKSLVQDSSITRGQMVSGSKRLVKLVEAGELTADVSDLVLRFGQIYTVNIEGEMTVPWNFE